MTTMPPTTMKGCLTSYVRTVSATPFTVLMSNPVTGTAAAVGDWVFLALSASSTYANTQIPTPTGFEVVIPWGAMGSSTTTTYGLFARRRQLGDGNYSISLDLTGTHTGVIAIFPFWFDGSTIPDITEWIIGTRQNRATSGGTFSNIAPSVATAPDNSAAWGFSVERTTAAEVDANLTVSGTGWTKQKSFLATASDFTLVIASKPITTAAATGNVTFTTTNTQTTNGEAIQIVFPPIPDAPPDGLAGTLWDGTDVVDGLWYAAGPSDTIEEVSWAGAIWPGYESVTDMVSSFFHCGHRGGSRNYPEMSLQSYTQAALRGYGALEVSLARTSDGVWFGLHDASLDRTSLGTGGGSGTTYVASAMTWAQVQTHDILPGSGAPVNSLHQPYMSLDQILNAYMRSHVIFIDPKAAVSNRAELIAILKNWPHWQEKIVAKYVPGNGTNSWLTDARAAGFATNAMFYAVDSTPNYSQADILGMEYGATQTVWDTILATGKPVMCHVCPDAAAIATGLGKGASGAMVSGIVQAPLVTMP